jgi:hypothetical protein
MWNWKIKLPEEERFDDDGVEYSWVLKLLLDVLVEPFVPPIG